MIELIINLVYASICVVYGFPFVATLYHEALAQGFGTDYPEWMRDTSWRGFITSPVRMWRHS
jgi:hypothetical protein